MREDYKKTIKNWSTHHIYKHYSPIKQRNIIAGIGANDADKTVMINFINAVRASVESYENQIDGASTDNEAYEIMNAASFSNITP